MDGTNSYCVIYIYDYNCKNAPNFMYINANCIEQVTAWKQTLINTILHESQIA